MATPNRPPHSEELDERQKAILDAHERQADRDADKSVDSREAIRAGKKKLEHPMPR